MKQKKCKICGTKFTPKYSTVQMVCSTLCSYQYAKKQKDKEWKKRKAQKKKELMTLQDHLKIAQVAFNAFIRARDKGKNCISCGKPARKKNAGHYRSVGGNPELRFEELNCHLQCEYCNTFKHGNLIEYRKNLIKKIGVESVEWLEGTHEPKKYTIPEVQEITKKYKEKLKGLK